MVNGEQAELPATDTIPQQFDVRDVIAFTDCLTQTSPDGGFIFAALGSGTNTAAPTTSTLTRNHPGVQLWRSTTTANSGYRAQTLGTMIQLGGGECWDVFFWTPNVLTTVLARTGFDDSATSTAPADGAYLNISGTTLNGINRNNTAQSATASSYTLATSTWHHGRVEVNANATLVTFTLFSESGTVLWTDTLSTNIPTGAGRVTGAGTIAYSSGTTAIDVLALDRQLFSVPGRILARGAD